MILTVKRYKWHNTFYVDYGRKSYDWAINDQFTLRQDEHDSYSDGVQK